jgi:methylmalonyl-CoA mutase N-terminal domain/subunit
VKEVQSEQYPERGPRTGRPVKSCYGPGDWGGEYSDNLGDPGQYPFTRGIHEGGYRDRLWTFRQYAGFGTAEESNARYRLLLAEGGTGLSVAFDLPSQIGYDSDDPEVEDEVGRVGVALDTLADAEILFRDISLDAVSTSFTINGTAAIVLAMYIAIGDRQGVRRNRLRGTVQNDILKEYVSRGTWIWPPTPSVRLIADTLEFCASETPKFNALSVAGAHFRDAGATAAQEMAFTLSDAIVYCDEVVRRGRMTIDDFAPVVSFFFYTHNDFFEEIAKYRAGRRRWAHVVKERYGARMPASLKFRAGVVCGGSTLQAPQPYNNVVRVAYQAMASVFGGVQSMFTAAWDEPFAIPSEESAMLALRTQQILAYETGVTRTVDPLAGSWFIESFTDAMDDEITLVMDDIEQRGGMVDAIESGYVQSVIAEEAYQHERKLATGERIVVGVNRFVSDAQSPDVVGYEFNEINRSRQLARLAEVKRSRSAREVAGVLQALTVAAKDNSNLMPPLIDAVKAYCTVGEIVSTLKDLWGEFQEPVVF